MIASTDNKKHGVVSGFSSFTAAMLNSMKQDVGLDMSIESLSYLRRAYAKFRLPAPSLDELYLLDRLIQLKGDISAPIVELYTDSEIISEVYSDMMAKRSRLTATNAPPSLRKMQNIPSRYMELVGKSSPLGVDRYFAFGEWSAVTLKLDGCHSILHTPLSAVGIKREAGKYLPGSLLIVVSPKDDCPSAPSAVSALLDRGCGIGGGAVIDSLGLIGAVCHIGMGAYIDTVTLPIKQPCALTDLCNTLHGSVLLAVDSAHRDPLFANADELGLSATVIGSLISGNMLRIRDQFIGTAALSIPLLGSIASVTPTAVTLEQSSATPFAANTATSYSRDTETFVSTYSISIEKNAFSTALGATLCAVADCVARGADARDVCLSAVISQPIGSDCQRAIEAVLGVYRAQIEFYLPDRDSAVVTHDDGDHLLSLTAAAPLKAEHSVEKSGALYLLAPDADDNGYPRFEELRRMWEYVGELCRCGDVKCAAAVAGGDVDTALRALIGDSQSSVSKGIAEASIALPPIPYGSILALTSTKIDGFFIGDLRIS